MEEDTRYGRVCGHCKKLVPLEGYYPSARRRRMWVCKDCERLKYQVIYARNKAFCNGYKLILGCADCGYRGHPTALEFDHLPGFKKLYQVSYMVGAASMPLLKAEIAKCEVVCANCHAIRTLRRSTVREWYQARRDGTPTPAQMDDPQQSFDLRPEE